jgi:energy-coupling factor transporter ATP-binding protein EcfA2
MHLADYDEQLVTGKAWTEPQHIEQRLADLTEHMENVIQKYLRNEYKTIEEYNAQAGEVAEPYRVLVVMDFPANFSEAAARRLVSIAQNGPRCGVYAVILVDTDKPLPYNFNLADLERASTVIAWDATQKRFVWQDDDFKDCQLELDTPPPAELFNRIVTTIGQAAKEASKVEVPFERIAPQQTEWWTGDSREGLRVALGPSGARKVQFIEFGKAGTTAHHALVAGKTGSGKSTLLHTLITNLALTYSPSEVELYLIDFRKGVEFKTYATHQLPHARVIAIESEREFGLSVLQGLDTELKHRGDLFRAAGVDHIADYRNKDSKAMPRVLLLVDEFQEFFTEDDPIASQSGQILDRLVRQGRGFGVHVLLGSQTLAGAYTLARSTIDQMAIRIALQCSEADSRLILADDNGAARLLTRPGEAIYNAANGRVEGNNNFQVAWLDDDKRDHYLDRVSALAQAANYKPAQSQIIFEGNAPAQVEKNRALADAITSRASGQGTRVAWLGGPIAIRDAVFANFRRQSGSNLLIVGQQDEAALGMMSVALIGLAAQSPRSASNLSISVLDFGATDSVYADYFDRLVKHLPHAIKIGRRRQLPDIINELATEVQRRIDADEANVSSRFLFVYGLQRARDLRFDEMASYTTTSSDQPAAPNPAQQFATILREGPDVGIHTLVYCDTLTNLNRNLDRRALREFGMRVIFQMSQEDSANLIDSPAASKLGQHRAFYYKEEEGRLEKFRPYALPSDQWLTWVGEQLRKHKS